MAAVNERHLSEFPTAAQILLTTLLFGSVVDTSSTSGYNSVKILVSDLAEALLGEFTYTQDLETDSKTIFGAINDLLVLSGTGDPNNNDGANNQLYIKYASADYSVSGMYIKLNDSWHEISLGGGSANFTECTQAQYDAWEQAGTLVTDMMYFITDGQSGGGGATIHEMTYTGTGTTSHDITFPTKPQMILAWDGLGLSNYYALLSSFRYGSTFTPITYYDGNSGGMLYDSLSYSADELTLTISGADAGAAMNASGNTYHIIWV